MGYHRQHTVISAVTMNLNGLVVIIGIPVAGWCVYLGRRWLQRYRRRQLAAQALPQKFVSILQRMVPLYRRMPADLRQQLQSYVNVFLHDKLFVGCGGLQVTDEMRITIAGNACLLLLNRSANHFPGFISILVYPDTYLAKQVTRDGDIVTQHNSSRAGESWHAGPLILSWADVLRGIADPADGHNVVLHEFAHKLDEQNGMVDGLPILRSKDDYAAWTEVLTREFADLIKRIEHHKNQVIDSYGATSPPEFFAVATESFFERGALMKKMLPDLYRQLETFYGVDTAKWR